jgi:hypothetical protein
MNIYAISNEWMIMDDRDWLGMILGGSVAGVVLLGTCSFHEYHWHS